MGADWNPFVPASWSSKPQNISSITFFKYENNNAVNCNFVQKAFMIWFFLNWLSSE